MGVMGSALRSPHAPADMKITEGLLGEHALCYSLFEHVESIAEEAETLAELIATERVLSSAVTSHAAVENDILFPALLARLDIADQLEVLRADHKEIELLGGSVRESMTLEEAREVLLRMVEALREHFHREDHVLFPLCERMLRPEELMELGQRWAERRRLVFPQLALGRHPCPAGG